MTSSGEPSSYEFRRRPWSVSIPLLAVTLVGTGVRATLLDQVMRRDEAQTFTQFAGSFAAAVTDYSAPNNHILHSVLVRLSTLVFGGHPWAIRLPSFLAGVGLIVAVDWWISSAVSRRAGLLAAALVAGSSMMIEYSTVARGYTMGAVAFVVLIELSRRLLGGETRRRWMLWVATAVLGFATVPVFAYPFAAVGAWLGMNVLWGRAAKEGRMRFLGRAAVAVVAVGALTALAYLPAATNSGVDAIIDNDYVHSVTWPELPAAWLRMGQSVEVFVARDGPIAVVLPILVLVAVLDNRHTFRGLLSPVVALVGPLLLLLLQRVSPPPRVWLFAWPLWLGLAGVGLARLIARSPRLDRRAWAVPATAVILVTLMGASVVRSGEVLQSREAGTFRDGPAVAALMVDRVGPDDRIVVESHPRVVLEYYLNDLGGGRAALEKDYRNARRLFVVVYHPRPQDLSGVLEQAGIPGDSFTAPSLLFRLSETDVYLMEYQGERGPP